MTDNHTIGSSREHILKHASVLCVPTFPTYPGDHTPNPYALGEILGEAFHRISHLEKQVAALMLDNPKPCPEPDPTLPMTDNYTISSCREHTLVHADTLCRYVFESEVDDFYDWALETQATLYDARIHIVWHAVALEWSLKPTGHVNPESYFLWRLGQWFSPKAIEKLHPSLRDSTPEAAASPTATPDDNRS